MALNGLLCADVPLRNCSLTLDCTNKTAEQIPLCEQTMHHICKSTFYDFVNPLINNYKIPLIEKLLPT